MNELTVIENVKGYVDQNGTVWLNLEDVARGLGFVETKGNYIRWQRVNEYLASFGFSTSGENGFIPENAFYLLAMKANNQAAVAFQMKVANEILPAIRKTGAYLPQSAPATLEDLIIMQAQSVKELKAKVAEIERNALTAQEEIKNLKDALIHHDKDWRRWINNQLSRVGFAIGDFSAVRNDSYKLLEERGRCRLKVRLANLRERLVAEGATKTMVDRANYMDVIEVEPRLKEIYTTIVKELAIRYAS
jgi:prophage antirepressor-like protein